MYDHRRLDRGEQRRLYDLTTPVDGNTPTEVDDVLNRSLLLTRFSQESAKLLADRHQQQYVFGQYQYSQTDWNVQITSLVGNDESQLWQLRYSWQPTWSLTFYSEWSAFVGKNDTEFGRVSADQQVSLGLQWVF